MTLYGDSDVRGTQQRFYQALLGGSPSCKSTPLGVCSGRGGCSLATNQCTCDVGYSGADCEVDCSKDNSCPTDAPQALATPSTSSPDSVTASKPPSASRDTATPSQLPKFKENLVAASGSPKHVLIGGIPIASLFLLLRLML